MTNYETNRFNMFKAVIDLLNKNSGEIKKIPALMSSFELFKNKVNNIEKKDKKYQSVSKGAADKKNKAENELIEYLNIIADFAFAFADTNGYENMKSLCDVTESELTKMRDADLLQRSESIFEIISGYSEDLQEAGVSQGMINDLNKKIDNYDTLLGGKSTKFSESKAARASLGTEFESAAGILKNRLDRFMRIFKVKNIDLFDQYEAVRVIKDL